jgi:hypothetical protein
MVGMRYILNAKIINVKAVKEILIPDSFRDDRDDIFRHSERFESR